jgi:hypothetical protein
VSNVISSVTTNDYYSKARSLKKDLGKDDFYQLMIEQLKNQDPTQPSNDLNQILQTATFSILDAVNSIRDTVADKNLSVMNYINLVGKQITYEKTSEDPLTNERTVTDKQAVVQGVALQDGKVALKVDGDVVYPNEIKSMDFQGSDQKALLQDTMSYFNLVGKQIDYTVTGTGGATSTSSGVVSSAVMKNGLMELTVGSDNVKLDQITGVYDTGAQAATTTQPQTTAQSTTSTSTSQPTTGTSTSTTA